jgi:hypothetical protein
VQINAVELLDLLLIALKDERGATARKAAEAFLQSGLLADVWTAATATPLQFRQLSDFRTARDALISLGAPESEMPVPEWLNAS